MHALATEKSKGLPCSFVLEDYRVFADECRKKGKKFDAIVSIGMFEHVGYKNYRTYMKVAYDLLNDDGKFLLHTIGGNKSTTHTDAWIEKYIFPNSMLPSTSQIASAYEGLFVMEDWHNFGPYYDRTLMAWHSRFRSAWPQLKKNPNYSERFRRMWRYYLLACAGSFRARKNQLWQIVLSKKPTGEYVSVR
jgi:cyclopropane-fatty-acyl-phospholipid synthase